MSFLGKIFNKNKNAIVVLPVECAIATFQGARVAAMTPTEDGNGANIVIDYAHLTVEVNDADGKNIGQVNTDEEFGTHAQYTFYGVPWCATPDVPASQILPGKVILWTDATASQERGRGLNIALGETPEKVSFIFPNWDASLDLSGL